MYFIKEAIIMDNELFHGCIDITPEDILKLIGINGNVTVLGESIVHNTIMSKPGRTVRITFNTDSKEQPGLFNLVRVSQSAEFWPCLYRPSADTGARSILDIIDAADRWIVEDAGRQEGLQGTIFPPNLERMDKEFDDVYKNKRKAWILIKTAFYRGAGFGLKVARDFASNKIGPSGE
jgi:hypothetical protein